jgi:hypothetical protein
MHQTENVNPVEAALNKLFSTIDALSTKIDELNERVDYMGSFVGLEIGEDGKRSTLSLLDSWQDYLLMS